MSTINTLTVSFCDKPGMYDPDSVYGRDITPEERVKTLTDTFVNTLKAYGVGEGQIDTSVTGCVTIKNPSKTAIEVSKYLSYTKIEPLHPFV